MFTTNVQGEGKNIKMNVFPGATRPGWEEVHVLSENPLQDVRDERLRHQTETGVDHRSEETHIH